MMEGSVEKVSRGTVSVGMPRAGVGPAVAIAGMAVAGALGGCGDGASNGDTREGGISPRLMADAIHTVIEADRTIYAQHVVDRLQDEEGVIAASAPAPRLRRSIAAS